MRRHCGTDSKPSAGAQGFTLIEVMITVAIVAILAAVALPAYFDYVRRGQLPEAFTNLADYRVKLEQYYQDNRNYGAAACADVAGAPSWANFNPANAQYFGYGCTLSGGGQGYTVTATGSAGRAVGHVYTIDSANVQSTTRFKNSVVAKNCWLIKGSEC
jgi:type IV pilus assembly protein PilE